MAISYEIDKKRRIVLCTASGICTAQDALLLHEQIQSDSDFDPSFSQLMDFTPAKQGDITADEVRMLACSGPFFRGIVASLCYQQPVGVRLLADV